MGLSRDRPRRSSDVTDILGLGTVGQELEARAVMANSGKVPTDFDERCPRRPGSFTPDLWSFPNASTTRPGPQRLIAGSLVWLLVSNFRRPPFFAALAWAPRVWLVAAKRADPNSVPFLENLVQVDKVQFP